MKNKSFAIQLDTATGYVSSIMNPADRHAMNWCAADGHWGKIHGYETELESCTVGEASAETVYAGHIKTPFGFCRIRVTIRRSFTEDGKYREEVTVTNMTDTVICLNRDTFGIELPFNDRYTTGAQCMVEHCHAHIWCGHNIAWVDALRMGDSDMNLGLYLTEGALDCYSQNGCKSNNRGVFILHPDSRFLKSGESMTLAWELFWHTGKEDFEAKIADYDGHIGIKAEHFTVFMGESVKLSVTAEEMPEVTIAGEAVEAVPQDGAWKIDWKPTVPGKYRAIAKAGGKMTWADIYVKIPFAELLEKRVKFIVRNQQCLDPESPLYGAFLVYDNEYDSQYFDFYNPDHNACRERLNIALLLCKYLQVKEDAEVRAAIERFAGFVFREFYEESTGEVFNTIGKRRDQLRLYNAPGVMTLFAELYFVTGDRKYIDHILILAEKYYEIGGKKCYANGLAIGKIIRAVRTAGMSDVEARLMELFHTHVDNIISIGTNYPIHEVNYEQTIVTPAVSHISEMGLLCEDKEHYIREATLHNRCLERFSGHQPSCFLHEIALRYWDGYWFGKKKQFGDTLPHHLSVLTARSYASFARLTGDRSWMDRAEECIRNCLSLISDDGRGAAAYLYPYKLDGNRGEYFDPWSNDQDLVLYDALYCADDIEAFRI